MALNAIANLFVLGIFPWMLSSLAMRHGWREGRPSGWNLAGIVPVAAGFMGILWSLRGHSMAAPRGWTIEATPHYPTPAYLLVSGPYQYSRNPIYIAEGAIFLGWSIFYGSLVMLGVVLAAAVIAGPVIVPREERGLEARFGESFREYKRTTPMFLGRRRR